MLPIYRKRKEKIFPRMWLAHVSPWQLYQLSRPVIFCFRNLQQNMLNVILQLTWACHGSKEFRLRNGRLSGACTFKQPNTNNPVSISVSLSVSDAGLCFRSVSRSLSYFTFCQPKSSLGCWYMPSISVNYSCCYLSRVPGSCFCEHTHTASQMPNSTVSIHLFWMNHLYLKCIAY